MKEISPHIQEGQQILSRIKRDIAQTLQKQNRERESQRKMTDQ